MAGIPLNLIMDALVRTGQSPRPYQAEGNQFSPWGPLSMVPSDPAMPAEPQQDYAYQNPEQDAQIIELKKRRAIAEQKQAEAEQLALTIRNPKVPSGQPRPGANAIRGGIGLLLQGMGRGQGDQFMASSGQVIQDTQNAQYQNQMQDANQQRAAMQLVGMQAGREAQNIGDELARLRAAIAGENAQDFEKWKIAQKGMSANEIQALKTISDPKSTRSAREVAIQTLAENGRVIPPETIQSILTSNYFEDQAGAKTKDIEAATAKKTAETERIRALLQPEIDVLVNKAGYDKARTENIVIRNKALPEELQVGILKGRATVAKLKSDVQHQREMEKLTARGQNITMRGQDISAKTQRRGQDMTLGGKGTTTFKDINTNYKAMIVHRNSLMSEKLKYELGIDSGDYTDEQKAEFKKLLGPLQAEIANLNKELDGPSKYLAERDVEGNLLNPPKAPKKKPFDPFNPFQGTIIETPR